MFYDAEKNLGNLFNKDSLHTGLGMLNLENNPHEIHKNS